MVKQTADVPTSEGDHTDLIKASLKEALILSFYFFHLHSRCHKDLAS